MLGTISAFAYRHRETNYTNLRQQLHVAARDVAISLEMCGVAAKLSEVLTQAYVFGFPAQFWYN